MPRLHHYISSSFLFLSLRYFAIVHPLRHFGSKKALLPISATITVLYNIPKFFELRYNFETQSIVQSRFRQHPLYITYYIFWSKFVFVELIPYIAIIVLNTMIMLKIYKSTSFQKRFRYQGTSLRKEKSTDVELEEVRTRN